MAEEAAKAAAAAIRACLTEDFTPLIAITLGSGCGDVADAIVPVKVINYSEVPGFPVSTVQGHAGQLILGHLAGVPIVGLKGRVHYYEGNPRSMVVPVYTVKLLGAKYLMITNASGSLREEMGPGALVALTDHMNFSGANPLIGPNSDGMGPRFPSLYNAYDPELRSILLNIAGDKGIKVHEGVYVGTSGPSFETPAEIKAYRVLGGDVVGMSTVGEVILARHCDLRVCAISVVVNYAAGMTDQHITHEETLHFTKLAAEKVATLVMGWVQRVSNL
eukprot:762790-Hanusia_phi.AAC.4